jgi:hypothetical protein
VPDNQCGQIAFAAIDQSTCEVTTAARTYEQPQLYFGEQITVIENVADFNKSMCCNRSIPPCLEESGLFFTRAHTGCDGPNFGGRFYCGGDGSSTLYHGAYEDMMSITRIDGGSFNSVEFNVGDGYVGQCYNYVWIRAYLDGIPIADYTVDMDRSETVGLTGGEFNELRVGAYGSAIARDSAWSRGDERARQAIKVDNVRIGSINLGPILSLSSTCPGTMTAQIINASPRSTIALIFALRNGQFTIPNGPCTGTILPITGHVQLITTKQTDQQGRATITGNVPPNACGKRLVIVDAATCLVSNVVRIE